tara:strand:- start:1497 stop:1694 length:198 start_codon:yes stop_codon:yes gene_type:complete
MAKEKVLKKVNGATEIKKSVKKTKKPVINNSYAITKSNGRVIHRSRIGDLTLKNYKAKGWKVEEL